MLLSHLPYVVWPALPDPFHAQVISVLHQLEATQWWTPDRLREHQFRQLTALLSHFNRTS
jgi:phenylacetate-CoA ligase